MNREKMSRLAGKLDVLFRVLQRIITIAMLVVLIVVAVLTAVNLINPDAGIGSNFCMVDIGPITVELAQQYAPTNRIVLAFACIYVLLGTAFAILLCHAFGCIRRILAPMQHGDPFRPEAADHIRRLAFISLWLGIVHNIGGMVETTMSLRLFGLEKLMEGGQIVSITANYSLDLTFLIGFFLLLLISYLFRYGAELQQLSDETL